MIKAETIIHEGSAGPNWLEHCRDVLTPQLLAVLVVILAVIVGLVYQHRHVAPVANTEPTTSQVNTRAPSLKVVAPGAANASDASSVSDTSLQPANNAGDAALPGTAATTGLNGAVSSPTSPASGTGAAVGPAATTSSNALQTAGGSLQQTTQSVQSVVNKVVNPLTSLGGLGL